MAILRYLLGSDLEKTSISARFLKESKTHTQTIKRMAIIKLKSFKQLDIITDMQLSMSH